MPVITRTKMIEMHVRTHLIIRTEIKASDFSSRIPEWTAITVFNILIVIALHCLNQIDVNLKAFHELRIINRTGTVKVET